MVARLGCVCAEVGFPKGSELDFSRPGKPTNNAFIEAFNGLFRAECLSAHWLLSLAHPREKMEARRRYYNEERPHGAVGYKPRIALMKPPTAQTASRRDEARKIQPEAIKERVHCRQRRGLL